MFAFHFILNQEENLPLIEAGTQKHPEKNNHLFFLPLNLNKNASKISEEGKKVKWWT